jgi:hypothetical protein
MSRNIEDVKAFAFWPDFGCCVWLDHMGYGHECLPITEDLKESIDDWLNWYSREYYSIDMGKGTLDHELFNRVGYSLYVRLKLQLPDWNITTCVDIKKTGKKYEDYRSSEKPWAEN